MKIGICGANGKMGKEVAIQAQKRGVEILFGIDIRNSGLQFPVYKAFSEIKEEPDCIIDFSNQAITLALLGYALAEKIPLVIGTTGLSAKCEESIMKAAQKIPIVYKHNLSYGYSVFYQAVKHVSELAPKAERVIVETHHNEKKDAPGGSALELACVSNTKTIHSIRIGQVIGKHTVMFSFGDEIIELTHTAFSRSAFANGALSAAQALFESTKQ